MSDSASIIQHPALPAPMPLPLLPISTRLATLDDLPAIDALQKQHHRQLGFFPRAQMEGYINNGWVVVAEEEGVAGGRCLGAGEEANSPATSHGSPTTALLGYCASRDRYLKRDELGAIFQLCVTPGRQRGLIGASLLKDVFDRASYGTRLYCCWCAQDLEANYFWEAMGFVPLAFRAGGKIKRKDEGGRMKDEGDASSSFIPHPSSFSARIHIFWQRRIRAGDVTTPYWFPSQTAGGSIREDRLVLPIPPGVHWKDVMPVVLPHQGQGASGEGQAKAKRLAGPKGKAKPESRRPMIVTGGLKFTMPKIEPAKKSREKQPRRKPDPMLVAATRELRDRWLEKVNENPSLVAAGKYDLSRLPASRTATNKLLAA